MSLTSWFLVNGGGTRHRLPKEMIFVGRDDCELMLQSRSVDKQHAVINYDPATDEHKVKDLGSLNGTFVNGVRIQEQQYITLKIDDKLRFGYDTNLFTVVRGELHIPEEALRHKKFSSQLQMTNKPSSSSLDSYRNTEADRDESGKEGALKHLEPSSTQEEKVAAGDIAVVPRGTPLYGQPSWWGDADDENSEKHIIKVSHHKEFKCETGNNLNEEVVPGAMAQTSAAQEPSYYAISSKEAVPSMQHTSEDHTVTEEGTPETSISHTHEGNPHGHASFTIEFNTSASSKIKERSTKCGQGHHSRPKRRAGEELSALQAAMVAAEVKVADWLAQNDLPLALSESVPEGDGDSVKSDVPVQLKSLRGSKHEDGTQSDSENILCEQLRSHRESLQDQGQPALHSRGGHFQNKPSAVSKILFQVGNEERQSNSSPCATKKHNREQQEGPRRCQADDKSDRGTYIIKLENRNTEEEEEARHMIEKEFRVEDSQALTRLRYPEQQGNRESVWPKTGATEFRYIGHTGLLPEDLVVVGGPRWISQWASLAANHIRTDPEGSGSECTMMDKHESGKRTEAKLPRSSFVSPDQSQHKQALSQDSTEPSEMDTEAIEGQWSSSERQDLEIQDKDGQLHGMSRARHRVTRVTPSKIDRTRESNHGTTKDLKHRVSEKTPHTSPGSDKTSKDKKGKSGGEGRETSGKTLLRQESFTMERPSANVPVERIPCIDGPGRKNEKETASISEGIDAATLLKDSEAVSAFLDTTISDLADPPSLSLEGSVSPESDVDTTSTVSQAGAEGGCKVAQKKRLSSGPMRATSKVIGGTKVKSHPCIPDRSNTHDVTSLDLTEENLSSSFAQGTHTAQFHSQGKTIKMRREANSSKTKETKVKTAVPTFPSSKPASVSQPRPTRASLLRRARLGTSDADLVDMDGLSVASEASTASSASRPSIGRKTLSRIETLAQPRRPRVSSPSARSDSEATLGRVRGVASRSGPNSVQQLGFHSSSVPVSRVRANSVSQLPDKSAAKSFGQCTTAAVGRWRHVPIEYASTSEDEFGSNRHPTKHTRPRPIASRGAKLGGSGPATPSSGGIPGLRHQSSREQEDYMRDWTTHSEEIARISQDLAKDLAMLAQEIHDVAGEIDSASPSSAPSALEHVFVGGLSSTPDISSTAVELRPQRNSNQEPRAIRRQTWNRDEAVLDSYVLASVSQLSAKIRQGVDKTASKIRFLFKDKDKRCMELESLLQKQNEEPLLKTSNQDIFSIFQDLKRVERQLLVIDIMLDPDGSLDALTSLGVTSPLASETWLTPDTQKQSGSHQAEGGSTSTPLVFSAASEVAEQELGLHTMNRLQSSGSQK
ncbi:centrosomal protein of 170 kDa [Hoplias malabaricus]|uniref:centrosomal protein of 170 kDa n=1 Tax=Hoplias malabaricus TaxID=27720 RepID=UPI0034621848